MTNIVINQIPVKGERLVYADLLRVIAMTGVVVIHISGGWLNAAAFQMGYWWLYNFADGLVRWCVPLFILLSGMFFLNPDKPLSLRDLFLRYLLRICVALAVWTVFYVCLTNWPGFSGLSFFWFFSCLKHAVLGDTYYHLWYLYMIAGLYLITPVLRVFVRSAGRREQQYFLLLCFLCSSVLPTLLLLRPSQTIQTYLSRLDLKLVFGYIGLYTAGYYFKAFPPGRTPRRIFYGLGLLGAAVTVGGTWLLSALSGRTNPILYNYNTPNVIFMAIALFLLIQDISVGLKPNRRISQVSRLSFGVYLVHPFFLFVLNHLQLGVATAVCSPLLAIPLQLLVVLACSLAFSWCVSKIPIVNRFLV